MKIPSDVKDVGAIREFLTTVRQQVCAMADYLSEPWKTHFNDLKGQYDTALSALPPSDQVPAAMEANRHLQAFWSCLASANALVSMLATSLNSKEKEGVTALNSAVAAAVEARVKSGELVPKEQVAGLVSAAVEERTKSGELVLKDTVTQLCSEAKTLGITEGAKAMKDEVAAKEVVAKKIVDRKAVLVTNSLPVPEAALESVLGGTDDEFAAARKQAEERIAALQKQGVALNAKSPLMLKVWLPKEQWEVFEALAVETLKGGGNGFAGGATPPDQGGKPGPMIC